MPINIFDFVLIVVLGTVVGATITYFIIWYLERGIQRGAREQLIERARAIEVEEGLSESAPPARLTFEPVLIREATNLVIFSKGELAQKTNLPEEYVESWLNNATRSRLIIDLSGGRGRIYTVNYEPDLVSTLEALLMQLDRVSRVTSDYRDKIIELNDRVTATLGGLGIKNILLITFDDILGPQLAFFWRFSRLIGNILENERIVTQIMMSSQISSSIELDTGDLIILSRFLREGEQRQIQNVIIAEVARDAEMEQIRTLLDRVGDELSRVDTISGQSLERIINNAVSAL